MANKTPVTKVQPDPLDNVVDANAPKDSGFATIRDQIFSQKGRSRFPLDLEGWPDTVYVLELTPAEVEQYDSKLNTDTTIPIKQRPSWYERLAYWLAIGLVDSSGSRIFNPDNKAAIRELMTKIPLGEMQKVESKIIKLNGLGKEGTDEVKNS